MSTLFKFLDPARQRDIIANATVYHAKCGRRRGYFSASDAAAYDRGYTSWPAEQPHTIGPARDGWFDCDQAENNWRAIQAEEVAERAGAGL